jgi:aminoglycoside 3-N-acetyltransferase I
MDILVKRLAAENIADARTLFALMATIFEEEYELLSDDYLKTLLSRNEFWSVAAYSDAEIIGGLTAYLIPLTRIETSEVFIYDIAVSAQFQRKGIGMRLVNELLAWISHEGASEAFVLADDEDTHALDFYRRVGGKPSPVTLFSFTGK